MKNIIKILIIIFIIYFLLMNQVEGYVSDGHNGHGVVDDYVGINYVFSFTTSPTRIDKIKPLIECLMAQTIPPQKIYANLPKVFKRDNTVFTTIPDFIKDNPNVVINWVDDIGPATKVIPTVEILKSQPEMFIISVDDDMYYDPHLVETFMEATKKYPESVITGASFVRDPERHIDDPKIYYAQILEGFSGVLYKVKYLSNLDISIFDKFPKYCYLADDFVLSNHILSQKIPIVSLETRELVIPFEYSSEGDALHKQTFNSDLLTSNANLENYQKCFNWYNENDKQYFSLDLFPITF